MTVLLKNKVIKHKATDTRWRILDKDPSGLSVWIINLDEDKALPQEVPLELFQLDGDFEPIDNPVSPTKLKVSEAAAKRRDAAYECILPLIVSSDIFHPSLRSPMVLARADELKCSPQTLYTYLRTWWFNGQSRQALTPGFDRCGNSASETNGRGRPSKYGTPTYQMTAVDHRLIEEIIKSTFLKSELMTLEATYQRLLEEHYSYIDAEGRLLIKPQGERPSSRQFRRHARKYLPEEMVIRSRKGNAAFELNNRPVLGSLRHSTFTVGDVYEIDSTVADVFLVHHEDRSKIVGKPCLYMIRDRKSNLIVGFYVGFEEASWLAALQAIASISEDKRSLCQRHGVTYASTDWPATGAMPKEFVADRGSEMLSNQSDKIVEGLELTITNLPARRADWKPHVECGFKQTHRSLRGIVPGYSPPENFGKRQVKDYSQDAALTLDEFRRIILLAIIKHNQSPMPGYGLAPQYILQGIQPTPINVWNTEIRDRAGLLNTYSEAEVRLALLPQTEVTISREGIRLGDCYYSAQEALDYGWFVQAGNGRFKVQATYDLRLVDTIYIHDPKHPDGYFEAKLLDKSSHYRGMSHREVEAISYVSRQLKQQGEQITRQNRANFQTLIASTIKTAKEETKIASQGQSRSARKKDTRLAREDARRFERQESQRPPLGSNSSKPTGSVLSFSQSPPPEPVANSPVAVPKSRQQKYMDLLNGK